MARYIAKNIVAAGLAERAEVQLAYAIGVAEPVSVRIDTFGTGKVGEAKLTELVRKNFSLTPKGIIESLNLRRPIYQQTAAYGHFGRTEPEFTWEATDKAAALAEQAGHRCRGQVNRIAPRPWDPCKGIPFFFRSFFGISRNSFSFYQHSRRRGFHVFPEGVASLPYVKNRRVPHG